MVFRVYMFFAFKLAKEQRLNPPLRKAKSLRLLTYLTLTIAGIIIIGSWIRLVFSLIDGDLPLKIALKIITVMVIASAVFGYYMWTLKYLRSEQVIPRRPTGLNIFLLAVIGLVCLSIISSFFLIKPPLESRAQRLDQQREENLSQISSALNEYYSRNQVLPASLEELTKQDFVYLPPVNTVDPSTKQSYEYLARSADAYQLCATFERSNQERSQYYPASLWSHGTGRTCFEKQAQYLYPQDGVKTVPAPVR